MYAAFNLSRFFSARADILTKEREQAHSCPETLEFFSRRGLNSRMPNMEEGVQRCFYPVLHSNAGVEKFFHLLRRLSAILRQFADSEIPS